MNTDWTLTRHATTPAPSIASALEARALKNTIRAILPGYKERFSVPGRRLKLKVERSEDWDKCVFIINGNTLTVDGVYRIITGADPVPSKPLEELPLFQWLGAVA